MIENLGNCHSSLHVWCIVTIGAFLVQVAALAKDSGPAVMRARLPAALSKPLMGRPPKVNSIPAHASGGCRPRGPLSACLSWVDTAAACDGAEAGKG
jgi:hypothetical protein